MAQVYMLKEDRNGHYSLIDFNARLSRFKTDLEMEQNNLEELKRRGAEKEVIEQKTNIVVYQKLQIKYLEFLLRGRFDLIIIKSRR